MTTRERLREELAELEHEQWVNATAWLLVDVQHFISALAKLPKGLLEELLDEEEIQRFHQASNSIKRWARQSETPYAACFSCRFDEHGVETKAERADFLRKLGLL